MSLFDENDLGASDYSGQDNQGFEKFISKPVQRRFQPFGGPMPQVQNSVAQPIEQPTEPSYQPVNYNTFENDLDPYDQLTQYHEKIGRFRRENETSAKHYEGLYDDFKKNELAPFFESVGGFGDFDNDDDFIAAIDELEKNELKTSQMDDGFFGGNKDKKLLAQENLKRFANWSQPNGLRDKMRRLRSEAQGRRRTADAAKAEEFAAFESLTRIPMAARDAMDAALAERKKAPKAPRSRKVTDELLDQFSFDDPVYDRRTGRVTNIEKTDPRKNVNLVFDRRTGKPSEDAAQQRRRMESAMRGDVDGFLSRRKFIARERQLRDKGFFFSQSGLMDGRPIGLSRKDVDLLDIEEMRKAGITSYQGKPLDTAFEELGGEERLKLAKILESVYAARSNSLQAQLEFLKVAGSDKAEKARKKMEAARETEAQQIALAAQNGLDNELFEQAETVGHLSAIGNAVQRGLLMSEMSNYTPDFLTNTLDADEIQRFIEIAQEIEKLPTSTTMKRVKATKSEGFLDAVGNLLFDNPMAIPEMFVESMSSFLPSTIKWLIPSAGVGAGIGTIIAPGAGTAAGAAFGARASWGAASFVLEASGMALEGMQELGIDWENPKVFAAAWTNESIRNKIQKKMVQKGVPIAIADTLTGVMAGRVMGVANHTGKAMFKGGKLLNKAEFAKNTASVPRFTKFQKTRNAAAELAFDSTMGMSGEYLGQWASKEPGEAWDWDAVAAEGIIGIGPGAVGAALEMRSNRSNYFGNAPIEITGEQRTENGTTGTINRAGYSATYQTFDSPEAMMAYFESIDMPDVDPEARASSLEFTRRWVETMFKIRPDRMRNLKIAISPRTPSANNQNRGTFESRDGNDVIYLNESEFASNPMGTMFHESGHFARIMLYTDEELASIWSNLKDTEQLDAYAQYYTKEYEKSFEDFDEATQKKIRRAFNRTPKDVLAEEWFSYQWARTLDARFNPHPDVAKGAKGFADKIVKPMFAEYTGRESVAGEKKGDDFVISQDILRFIEDGLNPSALREIDLAQSRLDSLEKEYEEGLPSQKAVRKNMRQRREVMNELERKLDAMNLTPAQKRNAAKLLNAMAGEKLLTETASFYTGRENLAIAASSDRDEIVEAVPDTKSGKVENKKRTIIDFNKDKKGVSQQSLNTVRSKQKQGPLTGPEVAKLRAVQPEQKGSLPTVAEANIEEQTVLDRLIPKTRAGREKIAEAVDQLDETRALLGDKKALQAKIKEVSSVLREMDNLSVAGVINGVLGLDQIFDAAPVSIISQLRKTVNPTRNRAPTSRDIENQLTEIIESVDEVAEALQLRIADIDNQIQNLENSDIKEVRQRPKVKYLSGVKAVNEAEAKGSGVSTLRKAGEQHFGNPFSHLDKSRDTTKTKTRAEAVEKYKQWLAGTDFKNVKQERRKWVLAQIDSGALEGKDLLYYTNQQPNHAEALAEFIAERRPNDAFVFRELRQREVKELNDKKKVVQDYLALIAPEQLNIDWKDTPHFFYSIKTKSGKLEPLTLGFLATQKNFKGYKIVDRKGVEQKKTMDMKPQHVLWDFVTGGFDASRQTKTAEDKLKSRTGGLTLNEYVMRLEAVRASAMFAKQKDIGKEALTTDSRVVDYPSGYQVNEGVSFAAVVAERVRQMLMDNRRGKNAEQIPAFSENMTAEDVVALMMANGRTLELLGDPSESLKDFYKAMYIVERENQKSMMLTSNRPIVDFDEETPIQGLEPTDIDRDVFDEQFEYAEEDGNPFPKAEPGAPISKTLATIISLSARNKFLKDYIEMSIADTQQQDPTSLKGVPNEVSIVGSRKEDPELREVPPERRALILWNQMTKEIRNLYRQLVEEKDKGKKKEIVEKLRDENFVIKYPPQLAPYYLTPEDLGVGRKKFEGNISKAAPIASQGFKVLPRNKYKFRRPFENAADKIPATKEHEEFSAGKIYESFDVLSAFAAQGGYSYSREEGRKPDDPFPYLLGYRFGEYGFFEDVIQKAKERGGDIAKDAESLEKEMASLKPTPLNNARRQAEDILYDRAVELIQDPDDSQAVDPFDKQRTTIEASEQRIDRPIDEQSGRVDPLSSVDVSAAEFANYLLRGKVRQRLKTLADIPSSKYTDTEISQLPGGLGEGFMPFVFPDFIQDMHQKLGIKGFDKQIESLRPKVAGLKRTSEGLINRDSLDSISKDMEVLSRPIIQAVIDAGGVDMYGTFDPNSENLLQRDTITSQNFDREESAEVRDDSGRGEENQVVGESQEVDLQALETERKKEELEKRREALEEVIATQPNILSNKKRVSNELLEELYFSDTTPALRDAAEKELIKRKVNIPYVIREDTQDKLNKAFGTESPGRTLGSDADIGRRGFMKSMLMGFAVANIKTGAGSTASTDWKALGKIAASAFQKSEELRVREDAYYLRRHRRLHGTFLGARIPAESSIEEEIAEYTSLKNKIDIQQKHNKLFRDTFIRILKDTKLTLDQRLDKIDKITEDYQNQTGFQPDEYAIEVGQAELGETYSDKEASEMAQRNWAMNEVGFSSLPSLRGKDATPANELIKQIQERYSRLKELNQKELDYRRDGVLSSINMRLNEARPGESLGERRERLAKDKAMGGPDKLKKILKYIKLDTSLYSLKALKDLFPKLPAESIKELINAEVKDIDKTVEKLLLENEKVQPGEINIQEEKAKDAAPRTLNSDIGRRGFMKSMLMGFAAANIKTGAKVAGEPASTDWSVLGRTMSDVSKDYENTQKTLSMLHAGVLDEELEREGAEIEVRSFVAHKKFLEVELQHHKRWADFRTQVLSDPKLSEKEKTAKIEKAKKEYLKTDETGDMWRGADPNHEIPQHFSPTPFYAEGTTNAEIIRSIKEEYATHKKFVQEKIQEIKEEAEFNLEQHAVVKDGIASEKAKKYLIQAPSIFTSNALKALFPKIPVSSFKKLQSMPLKEAEQYVEKLFLENEKAQPSEINIQEEKGKDAVPRSLNADAGKPINDEGIVFKVFALMDKGAPLEKIIKLGSQWDERDLTEIFKQYENKKQSLKTKPYKSFEAFDKAFRAAYKDLDNYKNFSAERKALIEKRELVQETTQLLGNIQFDRANDQTAKSESQIIEEFESLRRPTNSSAASLNQFSLKFDRAFQKRLQDLGYISKKYKPADFYTPRQVSAFDSSALPPLTESEEAINQKVLDAFDEAKAKIKESGNSPLLGSDAGKQEIPMSPLNVYRSADEDLGFEEDYRLETTVGRELKKLGVKIDKNGVPYTDNKVATKKGFPMILYRGIRYNPKTKTTGQPAEGVFFTRDFGTAEAYASGYKMSGNYEADMRAMKNFRDELKANGEKLIVFSYLYQSPGKFLTKKAGRAPKQKELTVGTMEGPEDYNAMLEFDEYTFGGGTGERSYVLKASQLSGLDGLLAAHEIDADSNINEDGSIPKLIPFNEIPQNGLNPRELGKFEREDTERRFRNLALLGSDELLTSDADPNLSKATLLGRLTNDRDEEYREEFKRWMEEKKESIKKGTFKMNLVDRADPLKQFHRSLFNILKKAGIDESNPLYDMLNTHGRLHQYFGKGYEVVEQANLRFIEPIKDLMREYGVDQTRFGEYLLARAAPSRNLQLQARADEYLADTAREEKNGVDSDKYKEERKKFYDDEGNFKLNSGITEEEAKKVVLKMEEDKNFKAFAKKALPLYYKMNLEALDVLAGSGMIQEITKESEAAGVKGFREKTAMIQASSRYDWFENGSDVIMPDDIGNYTYAPMQGFKDETQSYLDREEAWEEFGASGTSAGKGFDQRKGRGVLQGAFGRNYTGPNPDIVFAASINQYFNNSILAKKNEVAQTFGNMFEAIRDLTHPESEKDTGDNPAFQKRATSKDAGDILSSLANLDEGMIRELKTEFDAIFEPVYEMEKNQKLYEYNLDKDGNGKLINVERRLNTVYQNDPLTFVYRRDGEAYLIKLKETPEGMRMADTMKNLRYESLPSILQFFNKGTRFMARMFTSMNPAFIIPNFFRDLGTAAIHLTEDEKKKIAGDALNMKNIGSFAKSIFKAEQMIAKGDNPNDNAEIKKLMELDPKALANSNHPLANIARYQYAKKQGAKIGYFRHESIPDLIRGIQKDLKKSKNPGVTKKGLKGLFDFVESSNTAVENSIRMSAFWAAVKNGYSSDEAAVIARNVTVDFNQKGNLTQAFGALYVFFGASMNSMHRFVTSWNRRSPEDRIKMFGGIAAASMAVAIFNRLLDDDEDEEVPDYDTISTYKRDTNFILPLPAGMPGFFNDEKDTGYLSIPLPLGYNLFWTLGQVAADVFSKNVLGRGGQGMIAGTLRLKDSAMNAFNPIGGATIATIGTPTLATPFVELYANKNFMGSPIRYEDDRFSVPKPAYQMDPKYTPEHWTALSKMINEFMGGSDTVKGSVQGMLGGNPLLYADDEDIEFDISGNQMRHVFTGYLGGPGTIIDSVVGSLISGAQGELSVKQTNDIPIVNRFLRATTYGASTRNTYRDLRDVVKNAEKAVEGAKTIPGLYAKVVNDNRPLLRMSSVISQFEAQKNKYNKQKKKIEASKTLSEEQKTQRVDDLQKKELELMIKVIKQAQKLGVR